MCKICIIVKDVTYISLMNIRRLAITISLETTIIVNLSVFKISIIVKSCNKSKQLKTQ